jgi:hypothetical protein
VERFNGRLAQVLNSHRFNSGRPADDTAQLRHALQKAPATKSDPRADEIAEQVSFTPGSALEAGGGSCET